MIRFIKKFQWKTHLIKILGLDSPTMDLRIWPLKSRSATVESFLSSSRTPPQNLSWNGSRSIVQTTDQSFGDKNNESPLPLSPFFFLTNSPHQSTAQYARPNELIPFVLTTHISQPTIQLFDLFLFSFIYFHLLISFPIHFF